MIGHMIDPNIGVRYRMKSKPEWFLIIIFIEKYFKKLNTNGKNNILHTK